MPQDFSGWRVELRRHIGLMGTQMGVLPFEHPQKIVLLHVPNAGQGVRALQQVGYLSDLDGATIAYLPDMFGEMPEALREHVEFEAERLKAAGEFSDPPEA